MSLDADLAGEAVGPEETACGAGLLTRRKLARPRRGGRRNVVPVVSMASDSGEHAGLPGEKGLDAGAQARPIALGEIELAAEVEQGDLADLFAGAFGGRRRDGT